MNKEHITPSSPGPDRRSDGHHSTHFEEKSSDHGLPVMRGGNAKDWRGAEPTGGSDESAAGDPAPGSAGKAQNEPSKPAPSGETLREGTWKDWRSAESGNQSEDAPKSGQSPRDQVDAGGNEPPPTMRDGTPRKP